MPIIKLRHLDNGNSWLVEVKDNSFLVGRSREAEVSIRDTSVSKEHVRIEKKSGRFHFRDLDSRNGTYINDFPCKKGPLSDGDEIRVGRILLTFYKGEDAARAEDAEWVDKLIQPSQRLGEPIGDDTLVLHEPDDVIEIGPSTPTPSPVDTGHGSGDSAPPGRIKMVVTPDFTAGEEKEPGSAASMAAAERKTEQPPKNRPRTKTAGPKAEARLEDSRRAAAPARHGWSTLTLTLLCVLSCGSGVLLGWLAARLDGSAEATPPVAKEAGSGQQPPTVEAPTTQIVGTTYVPEGTSEPWLPLLVGPRADLRDAETAHRGLVRLFLDLLDRPPTRSEVRQLLALSHEERWKRVRGIAAEAGKPPPADVPETFTRFLGRLSRPAEHDRLLADARGDIERLGFLLVSSSLYSSRQHRRERSAVQHANSIWVDLLDRPPLQENTDTVLELLQKPDQLREGIRVLLFSDAAETVAVQGEARDAWVRNAYVRCLLRFPTTEELETAVTSLQIAENGWRQVLQDLVLRADYKRY